MKDPIVEQVRRIKEAQAAKFNYDVRAIADDARRRQWDSGHQVLGWDAKRKRAVAVQCPKTAHGKTLAASK